MGMRMMFSMIIVMIINDDDNDRMIVKIAIKSGVKKIKNHKKWQGFRPSSADEDKTAKHLAAIGLGKS